MTRDINVTLTERERNNVLFLLRMIGDASIDPLKNLNGGWASELHDKIYGDGLGHAIWSSARDNYTAADFELDLEKLLARPPEIGRGLDERRVCRIQGEILREMLSGKRRFGPFSSLHEWYGVLKEEVDEAWDRIKQDDFGSELRHELVQIAAVALRGILELPDLRR